MATYKRQLYLLMSSDPIHVGTGGYRLGRVDLSIVREPGTRLPKIPGTSLSGAARSYAAAQYRSLPCAGQKQNHCGKSTCPICYTFGSLKGTEGFSGVVNFFDAHVLLFPVHSMTGPVWISTPQRLEEAAFTFPAGIPEFPLDGGLYSWLRSGPLNLGWLMLDAGPQVSIEAPQKWRETSRWQAIKDRLVLVQEGPFSQVVNSNLEVRTSVSIDPERGAAEEGALFTYEALPRATFLVSELVLDDYRDGQKERPFTVDKTRDLQADLPGGKWKGPLDVVRAGMHMAGWLGIGGMGTRGFGRLTVIGKEPLEQPWGTEGWQ